MANHPFVLGLRFLLELAALFALGYWGWTQQSGLPRFLWAIGLPLLAAVAWGTLRVPGHPGDAPIAVPGPVRLWWKPSFSRVGCGPYTRPAEGPGAWSSPSL